MNLTINLAWWAVPSAVSALALLWAFFWPLRDDHGMFADLTRIFMLMPACAVSAVAWALAGFFK